MSNAAPRGLDAKTTAVFNELVLASLDVLLPVTTAITWVWASVVVLTSTDYTEQAYLVLIITIAAAFSMHRLRNVSLHLAVLLYLATLCATVTLVALMFRSPTVFFLYMLVALLAGVLTNVRTMLLMTTVCLALIVVVGSEVLGMGVAVLAQPILFVLLTVIAGWLSWRRLSTALAWTLRMSGEAQVNADEARAHRAQLQVALKSLDQTLARLERTNRALIFARENAERAYRFKAEFVTRVSHELRTPLNLIIGFSEMVAMAPESYQGIPLPNEYRGDVMAIYRSARHLGSLINDVLDLSQIESGNLALHREATNLTEVIHEAAGVVQGLADAKGIKLEVVVPALLPLYVDTTRVRQVVINLLGNATRFTDEGSIRVEATVTEDGILVCVSDTGRGIPEDKITGAFEAFSQLHDDPSLGGSGLGLAVSRRFIELHEGRMWIESTYGRGTSVYFTLPRSEGKQARGGQMRQSESETAETKSKGAVFVLHTDQEAVAWLQRHSPKYEYVCFSTVNELAKASAQAPAVPVIVDPTETDVDDLFGAQSGLGPDAPLLSIPLPSQQRLARRLGVAGYLVKPISREQLTEALDRLPGPLHTVLAIDDDPNFVRLLSRMLATRRDPVRIIEASGGVEGLELARLHHPDLVLLDLEMPEGSGHGFLQALRGEPGLRATEVIVTSAHGIEEDGESVRGEIVLKRANGFTLDDILQAIDALLSSITQGGAGGQSGTARSESGHPG